MAALIYLVCILRHSVAEDSTPEGVHKVLQSTKRLYVSYLDPLEEHVSAIYERVHLSTRPFT